MVAILKVKLRKMESGKARKEEFDFRKLQDLKVKFLLATLGETQQDINKSANDINSTWELHMWYPEESVKAPIGKTGRRG